MQSLRTFFSPLARLDLIRSDGQKHPLKRTHDSPSRVSATNPQGRLIPPGRVDETYLRMIFEMLKPDEICKTARVSLSFYSVTVDEQVWIPIYRKQFGESLPRGISTRRMAYFHLRGIAARHFTPKVERYYPSNMFSQDSRIASMALLPASDRVACIVEFPTKKGYSWRRFEKGQNSNALAVCELTKGSSRTRWLGGLKNSATTVVVGARTIFAGSEEGEVCAWDTTTYELLTWSEEFQSLMPSNWEGQRIQLISSALKFSPDCVRLICQYVGVNSSKTDSPYKSHAEAITQITIIDERRGALCLGYLDGSVTHHRSPVDVVPITLTGGEPCHLSNITGLVHWRPEGGTQDFIISASDHAPRHNSLYTVERGEDPYMMYATDLQHPSRARAMLEVGSTSILNLALAGDKLYSLGRTSERVMYSYPAKWNTIHLLEVWDLKKSEFWNTIPVRYRLNIECSSCTGIATMAVRANVVLFGYLKQLKKDEDSKDDGKESKKKSDSLSSQIGALVTFAKERITGQSPFVEKYAGCVSVFDLDTQQLSDLQTITLPPFGDSIGTGRSPAPTSIIFNGNRLIVASHRSHEMLYAEYPS